MLVRLAAHASRRAPLLVGRRAAPGGRGAGQPRRGEPLAGSPERHRRRPQPGDGDGALRAAGAQLGAEPGRGDAPRADQPTWRSTRPCSRSRPGEERNVRIGAITPFGPVEKTYRVFLQEMAPPETPEGASQVRVLSRIGLPDLPVPRQGRGAGTLLLDLAARGGKVTFRLANEGTVHVRPTSVKVVGLGTGRQGHVRDGAPRLVRASQEESGVYEVEIPPEGCASIREIEVSAALPREVHPRQADDAERLRSLGRARSSRSSWRWPWRRRRWR